METLVDQRKAGLSKSVGRKPRPITFEASGESLARGAAFNDEIHRSFGAKDNGVPIGVYRFKSHEDANRHMESCIAKKMAKKAGAKP